MLATFEGTRLDLLGMCVCVCVWIYTYFVDMMPFEWDQRNNISKYLQNAPCSLNSSGGVVTSGQLGAREEF